MHAIILSQGGYSGRATGPQIDDAAKYLDYAKIKRPAPRKGQVLIKVRAASVNPSDLHFIKGEYGQPRIQGTPAGFEGCGDVVEAGAGAEKLLGLRVAFVVGPGGSGAWAEYAVADAVACIPLRSDISDEDGAAQIVNPLTAMAMVDMVPSGGAFVISAASSQLGKLMIGLAQEKELKTIALVRRPALVDGLKALGASVVLDVTAKDFAESFATASKALLPSIFLDAVADQISEQVFVAMPAGARWVCYGKLGAESPVLSQIGQLIFMGKCIEGFWLSTWLRHTDPVVQKRVVGAVQARFADGRWHTDISMRLGLNEVVERLPEATKRLDGKVIIKP
ncbi:MAG: alcohol dehydrogenase catalytic domain-containing protein [Rhodobacteraceae bacterium]|nr:alcohol dehydrogenase catalytic domain-containing protein [Paracoccaceae bacterium]